MRLLLLASVGALLSSEGSALAHPDRELFAAVLIAEAVSEGAPGMQGVANVVMNRRHILDPENRGVFHILVDPSQFSCLNGRTTHELIAKAKADRYWSLALMLADSALANTLPDLTYRAVHFHSGRAPRWAASMTRTTTIGRLHFYRQ